MADAFRRPYLDAQSWITALSGKGPYAPDLAEILRAADRGQLVVVVSALMPMEVLGGSHDSRTEESAARAELALKRSCVQQVSVTARVVADARRLRLDRGLTSMDALHVASAVAGRADILLTDDDKIHALGEFRGLPIRRPTWPGDLPLQFGAQDDH